jgi:hypothetical protein
VGIIRRSERFPAGRLVTAFQADTFAENVGYGATPNPSISPQKHGLWRTASNDYRLSTANAFLSGSQSEESTFYVIENERVILVAPQGFEPRYAAPEAAVLPLNEGAMQQM